MSTRAHGDTSGGAALAMYDAFSADYDRFVDWESRLASEIPFLERQLKAIDANRVLDTACGTGMHALALAKRGYEVVGTDLSAGMIARARKNADQLGLEAEFVVAGFGELARILTRSPSLPGRGDRFDAVLCLGNSLPHVLTPEELVAVLGDFAACLRPGGLLLVQNRNFDAVMAEQERWMAPQACQENDREWLFLRFYDYGADGLVTFNVVRLRREGDGHWSQRVTSTRLWPQTQKDLTGALQAADFDTITCFGNLKGDPFESTSSPNLVVAARRPGD